MTQNIKVEFIPFLSSYVCYAFFRSFSFFPFFRSLPRPLLLSFVLSVILSSFHSSTVFPNVFPLLHPLLFLPSSFHFSLFLSPFFHSCSSSLSTLHCFILSFFPLLPPYFPFNSFLTAVHFSFFHSSLSLGFLSSFSPFLPFFFFLVSVARLVLSCLSLPSLLSLFIPSH